MGGPEGAPWRRRAVPLAQLRDSYIVAEDETGLVLVDQHAAHERVLFERYLSDAEAGRVETQALLFPVVFDASAEELARLEEERPELARLGFAVEAFGRASIRVDAIPALAASADPERLVRDLLGEAARTRSVSASPAGLRRRLVTTAACHAAIKVRHRLTTEAMAGLLEGLWATENPTTCPHGRPSVFHLSLEEIERAFRRR
jgi:DNA mismatch repair protein MutL